MARAPLTGYGMCDAVAGAPVPRGVRVAWVREPACAQETGITSRKIRSVAERMHPAVAKPLAGRP